MKSKFSPVFVIKDFFEHHKEEQYKIIGIPLISSVLLMFFVNINMELINILLVSLSILIGFLLNLMLASFNLKDSKVPPREWGNKLWYIQDFLLEYHITISFELLISISLVIILLFVSLVNNSIFNYVPVEYIPVLRYIFNFIVIYELSLFFIVIFRVLKFGHVLLKYYLQN